MKRRFAVTLLAVAIAIVIGAPAYATAPVIGAIRNVVIADDVPATTDNIFVYPDALALNSLAEDDNVSSGAITWSYAGTGRYTLNSRGPIDVLTEDPNSPGAKEVGEVLMDDDTGQVDGDVRTVTFRDTTLSPVGGPNTDPTPGDPSSSTVHSEVVTLFASDGSTYSQKNIMVYTESNGVDRLSGSALIRVDQLVPTQGGPLGWTSSLAGSGTLTDNNGLCINVPVAGSNFAQWIGPYGIIDLVQNNVFRIRMEMDSDGATLPVGTTPFWDLLIDNYDLNTPATPNKYVGYFTNWDTEGGANAIGQVAAAGGHGGIMDVWWCPPAINTASWNDPSTGMFTSTMDTLNDVRVNFRVLDVQAGALDGQNDGGAVCLNRLTIDRIPFSQLAVQSTPYNETALTALTHVVAAPVGQTTTTPGGTAGTLVQFSGGDLTVSPNTTGSMGTGAWSLEVVQIDMGDSDNNPTVPTSLTDNYPVPWNDDELLMGSVGIQAPNAQGGLTPPDGLMLQWDTPTNELLIGSGTYSTDNTAGMPKDGVNEELVGFYYTHTSTASSIGNGARIRMRVVLLCSPTFNSGGNVNNLGGVTITNERVDVIEVPAGQ